MNIQLTENIVRHILANFLIIPSNYVNTEKSKALMNKDFLLKEKITIETDGGIIKNNVYGCQLSFGEQEVKIIAGDCTQEINVPEFCLLVQLKNTPCYGLYLVYNDMENDVDSDPMIACSLDGKAWMPCTTFLQATFLSGMEQMKDSGFIWSQCIDYQNQFNSLMSFLDYYNTFYEAQDARQEN